MTDEVVQWMERIQNSGVDDDPPVSTPTQTHHSSAANPHHPNSLRDDSSRHVSKNNSIVDPKKFAMSIL